ncbi:ATP-dependent DNA ligase [Catellatospora citrea]|uniref:ATP-dependent DNA ligase n=1 Tax=Catellatospora citrea TaxID=53366 RepID=UPI0033E0A6AB
MAGCTDHHAKPSELLRPPLEPMLAAPIGAFPAVAGTLRFEMKLDGWRALVFHTARGVRIQSRHGRDLSRYFPDVVAAARALPVGAVVDAELVIWDAAAGRTSFTQLQRRITTGRALATQIAAHPAHLACFDLLHDGTSRLLDEPLHQRRARLEEVISAAPTTLSLCPQTDSIEQAQDWMRDAAAAGVEGLVIKDSNGIYRPGYRGWQKLRRYDTTEAIIAGITTTGAGPHTVLLGRYDTKGTLRYIGRTVPLDARQRRDLAQQALPQRRGAQPHPWPQPLPATWAGQLRDPQPLHYTPVAPLLVAEVQADLAWEYGRYRHPLRLVRIRTDLLPADVDLHKW